MPPGAAVCAGAGAAAGIAGRELHGGARRQPQSARAAQPAGQGAWPVPHRHLDDRAL